jgi:hypothetical protein
MCAQWFAAVIIDEHRAQRGTFDYSRIEIEPTPLTTRPSPSQSPRVPRRAGAGGRRGVLRATSNRLFAAECADLGAMDIPPGGGVVFRAVWSS